MKILNGFLDINGFDSVLRWVHQRNLNLLSSRVYLHRTQGLISYYRDIADLFLVLQTGFDHNGFIFALKSLFSKHLLTPRVSWKFLGLNQGLIFENWVLIGLTRIFSG